MKKIFLYIITIILGISIPIYFLLIWEPLKSEKVISKTSVERTGRESLNNDEILNNIDMSDYENEENINYSEKNNYDINDEPNINNSNNSSKNSIKKDNDIEALSIKQNNIKNNLFGELEKNKKEKIDNMLKGLSIVDIIRLNDCFSNKDDKDSIREGLLLVEKRMTLSDYEEFKSIIGEYVDLNTIEEKI